VSFSMMAYWAASIGLSWHWVVLAHFFESLASKFNPSSWSRPLTNGWNPLIGRVNLELGRIDHALVGFPILYHVVVRWLRRLHPHAVHMLTSSSQGFEDCPSQIEK
jgi:hypothetical protein